MVRLRKFFQRFYLALLIFFLYLPIFMLMVFSFNEGKTMSKWFGMRSFSRILSSWRVFG